jgi:hypothetical protein
MRCFAMAAPPWGKFRVRLDTAEKAGIKVSNTDFICGFCSERSAFLPEFRIFRSVFVTYKLNDPAKARSEPAIPQ